MDDSKVRRAEGHGHAGAVVEQRRLAGAHVARIMHPPRQRIEAHSHAWPVLTLYRLGGYREEADCGAAINLDGPSVVIQPAGAAHADEIGDRGLETLSMTFDPAWLLPEARRALPARTQWRLGGAVSEAARLLARVWLEGDAKEAVVRAKTSELVSTLARQRASPPPSWGAQVAAALDSEGRATMTLARSLSLHPAWLARAYRAWRGEGIAETVRRRRVERAVIRLRASAAPVAEIALECGFCDQSHMNRAFRAVLGRTPLKVRREAALLTQIAPPTCV